MTEDLKTYRGNCHCGKFVYEVKLPEIKEYDECNCSICRRKGYAFVKPGEGNFQFVTGSMDELKTYTFGNQYFTHCARAIQGLDIWSLKSKIFDGKALPPPYEPPIYDGPEPSMEVENGKLYYGSCHCGAVRLVVRLKPLETWDTLSDGEERIVECNCSVCVRGAQVWCYPHKDQSVVLGRENISYRIFNVKTERKAFCKRCGVPLFNETNPLSDGEVAALSDREKKWRQGVLNNRNINLRILHNFDYKVLKTKYLDGARDIPGDYVDP